VECSDYTPIRIRLFGNFQSMQDLLANIHCYVIFKYVHECDIYRKKNWSFKSSSVYMNIFTFIIIIIIIPDLYSTFFMDMFKSALQQTSYSNTIQWYKSKLKTITLTKKTYTNIYLKFT
jgi:hypothetical protein